MKSFVLKDGPHEIPQVPNCVVGGLRHHLSGAYWVMGAKLLAGDYLLVRISTTQMLIASSHWGRTAVSIESWRQPPIPDAGYLGCPANRPRKGPYWFYKSGPADSRLGAELPHLSVTMLLAMLAVVPWIRRFSLRTLLIVITLFAAFLASVVSSN